MPQIWITLYEKKTLFIVLFNQKGKKFLEGTKLANCYLLVLQLLLVFHHHHGYQHLHVVLGFLLVLGVHVVP